MRDSASLWISAPSRGEDRRGAFFAIVVANSAMRSVRLLSALISSIMIGSLVEEKRQATRALPARPRCAARPRPFELEGSQLVALELAAVEGQRAAGFE
jgi:hypothetical protein